MTDLTSVRARRRQFGYWAATLLVSAELVVGGAWDVLRVPQVSGVVGHLGYPPYFLVILGVWKLLGAAALLAPRFPVLKEWAYAGVVFADTGAVASHLVVGYGTGEVAFLVVLTALTALSWSLRPPSRRIRAGLGDRV
ncbi:DoxX family protein [Streptomyces winkii]|uniref:DoxX family protein n=1 Tax=Streptomyces winkii TaxID=3051178 RepID=UPI0028D3CAF4|nr:DoxX family protein [Streptomyces sp. DSM 40971]